MGGLNYRIRECNPVPLTGPLVLSSTRPLVTISMGDCAVDVAAHVVLPATVFQAVGNFSVVFT